MVVDLPVVVRDRCGPLGVHCQTAPALFGLETGLNVEEASTVPRLDVDYGFETPELRAEIELFFETALRPTDRPLARELRIAGAV